MQTDEKVNIAEQEAKAASRKIYVCPPDSLGQFLGKGRHGNEYMKICVSGAAETGHCGLDIFELGKEIGRQIAMNDAVLTTGATTGFPLYAAMGVKDGCGFSVGFSPAATEREHVETYKLPLEYMDMIIYTGFGFPGRDLMLTRSSDAVIVGCGRIGTFHEFTIAFEDRKPIGVLEGQWETDDLIKRILEASHRPNNKIVFDSDPKALIEKVIELVKKDKAETNLVYKNDDHIGGTNPNDERLL